MERHHRSLPMRHVFSSLLLALAMVMASLVTAEECVQDDNCRLPDCFCPTFIHPLGAKNIPQIVYFGFDDAVQVMVSSYYDKLFTQDRTNPNGCPITMSLYISNEYTGYDLVHKYYKRGDEAGVHSVTHQDIDTAAKLLAEATEQKMNIEQKADVPSNRVVGWRSPNLKTAGDDQPRILKQLNYTYDISLSYTRDLNYPFPFTLDYGYPYPCAIQPCPKSDSKHEGFWEVMIHTLTDPKTGLPCGYVDGCRPESEDDALEYLWSNFLHTYENEKAPFGLNMHAAWFAFPDYLPAMSRFIDRILSYPDVFIVNAEQMISWMKNPTPLSEINSFQPWGCGSRPVKRSNEGFGHHSSALSHQTPLTHPRPAPTNNPNTNHANTIHANTNHGNIVESPSNERPVSKFQIWGQRFNNFNNYRPSRTNYVKTTTTTQRNTPSTITTTTTTSTPRTNTTTTAAPRIPSFWQRFVPQGNFNSGKSSSEETVSCIQNRNCQLPKCFCKTNSPPLGLSQRHLPQIVYLAIDTHIDGRTFRPLMQIFSQRRENPTGSPVTGSIFIPTSGNYPPYVTMMRKMGARLGIQLDPNTNFQRRRNQINEARRQYSAFHGIRSTGINAEHTRNAFEAFQTLNDTFDNFLVKDGAGFSWPYTLDFGTSTKRCSPFAGGCSSSSEKYPGLWEVDLSPLQARSGEMETFQVLKYEFDQHFFTNRSPFGININESWLLGYNSGERIRGVNLFIDYILRKQDVMVVSIDKMIEWIALSRK